MVPITVLIANRNNARFLRRCLDSVRRQTFPAGEILVVDDASTDESRELLRTYADAGTITLIENERQLGVAASRAIGAASARGRFLTTLDADDFYFTSEKLAAEAALVDVRSQGTIAFSDVMRVDERGTEIGLVSNSRKIREGNLFFDIRHLRGFIPRDYLVSREDYLRAGGYNREFKIYEDWDLKIRLARFCVWRFSGVVGTAYTLNSKGLSKAPRRQHIEAMRRVFWANCPAESPYARRLAFARFFVFQSLYMRRPAASL
ncbi:MAG: glycosyltransferase family 2 protein [Gemmatimonadaceae bacterium]